MNHHETFLVNRIDRKAAWLAKRADINADAKACVASFMAAFSGAEKAVAADALVRAVAAAAAGATGASCAVRRFAGSAGRAEVLPEARFHGRRWT